MADINYAYREDKSCSGFFEFTMTGVQYSDSGVKGLKYYAPFDQGEWLKVESVGTATLTKGFDSTTSRIYDLLTSSTAGGTYTLYRRLRIPREFGHWSTITLFMRKTSVAIDRIGATMYRAGEADDGVTDIDIEPTTLNTWEQFALSPTNIYSPGDFVTLAITFVITDISVGVWLADIVPLFVSDKGNV